MKNLSLSMAFFIVLNTAAVSHAQATVSEQRQQELIELADKNPRKALANLTDAELLQMNTELKQIIQGLQVDMAVAEAQDGEKLGYKIAAFGKVSMLGIVGLAALGLFKEAKVKGPDNATAAVIITAFFGLSVASIVVIGGHALVWLTPSQVAEVQDKIDAMVKLSTAIDKKLK